MKLYSASGCGTRLEKTQTTALMTLGAEPVRAGLACGIERRAQCCAACPLPWLTNTDTEQTETP